MKKRYLHITDRWGECIHEILDVFSKEDHNQLRMDPQFYLQGYHQINKKTSQKVYKTVLRFMKQKYRIVDITKFGQEYDPSNKIAEQYASVEVLNPAWSLAEEDYPSTYIFKEYIQKEKTNLKIICEDEVKEKVFLDII